jgi:ribonuclease HI
LELRHAEGSTAWGDGSKQEDKTTGAAITGAAFHVRNPQDPTKGTTCMVDTRELPQEINAAELAAIWAALRAGYTVIATDSLTSLLQIARAARHPDSLEQHRYRFLLMEIVRRPVTILKVRGHLGHTGNEGADMGAKMAARATRGFADCCPALRDANAGRPVLARRTANGLIAVLKNNRDALKAHEHEKWRLGRANLAAYYTYHAALHSPTAPREGDPEDPGDRAVQSSLAWLTRNSHPYVTKVIFQYRTGTLWNWKLAFRMGQKPHDRCPLCGQADSAGHILSGCKHDSMSRIVTERHNQAGRLIAAAVDEAGKGGGLVMTDVGRAELMAEAGLEHLPHTKRAIPPWLVAPTLQHKLPGVGSIPDAILVEHTDTTAPECTPESIPISSRRVTLIEIKFCPDTRPGAQLEKARTQHKALVDLITSSGSTVRVLPILLGIGATMYQRHTQQALWELGIPHKQTTQLLNELSRLAGQKAAELVRRRRAEETKSGG